MPAEVNQGTLPEDSMLRGVQAVNGSLFMTDYNHEDPSTPSSTSVDFDNLSDIFGLSAPRSSTLFGNSNQPVPSLANPSYYSNGVRAEGNVPQRYMREITGVSPFSRIDDNMQQIIRQPVGHMRGSPPYSDGSSGSPTATQKSTYNTSGRSYSSREHSPDSDTTNPLEISELLQALSINGINGFGNAYSEQDQLHQQIHNITNKNNMSNNMRREWVRMVTNRNKQNINMMENDLASLESAARSHRTSAVSGTRDALYTWSGQLPQRCFQKNGAYSCKVFLGGVPWDITEAELCRSFGQFGPVKIEWPGKEVTSQPKGYVYVTFETDTQVKQLLEFCCHDHMNGGSWYFNLSSRKFRSKEVQVIPWLINDSNYIHGTSQKLDPQKTIFVGALHGMMTAETLYRVMDDLFGGVVYAGIDTDKNKYPIGSGRVTFANLHSYAKAVAAAFVEIKTARFTKKVQIDPYLEDSPCSICTVQQGPYFCRDSSCFRYYCTNCWNAHHNSLTTGHQPHKPLMRNSNKIQHNGCSATVAPHATLRI